MILNNKIIVITGGANGIGLSIAKTFKNLNCKVFVLDIDNNAIEKLESQNIQFITTDVSDPQNIIVAFKHINKTHEQIDILINNAGISEFTSILDTSIEQWDKVINTNLRSAFVASKEFAKHHKHKSYGRIINIASTRHLMSEPNSEAYATSKGGLVSLTHALAMSLQDENMTVNCISPGWINSKSESLSNADKEQHPSKRVGTPEDIANMCLFLCQPENDIITGQNFYIDGGMTRKMIYAE